MLTFSDDSSLAILLFLPEQTPSVVLDTKQTVHKFASVAVTVEVEVVSGKKILGFLTLNNSGNNSRAFVNQVELTFRRKWSDGFE